MRQVVSPTYQHLKEWVAQIPQLFATQQGTLLYNGRNQIRLFEVGGEKLVVKRYKRHDWVKMLIYTFFRPSKARRAYENATTLRKYNVGTPHEVAYLESTCAGLVQQVYYVCAYTDWEPIKPRLIEQSPYDEMLAVAYAHFVASLHEAGILHRDLNPTNVLYHAENERYDFQLIDINRMQFFEGAVPKAECMENLTLFWWLTPIYRFILQVYATDRGWTDAEIEEACEVKRRHDRRWVRRKRITHMFRKKK
jgi:serine/threonine protein kinase